LRSVNLEVGEGELVGVTGPAAAGKTTLCMAISGLIPHYVPGHMEGIVRVHGLSTRETPIGQLSRIVQVVFQEASTQLVMSTVLEEIAYPLMNVLGYSASEAIAEARRVMGEMGILHLEDRNPKTCSGGEKQRILLALMTALRPRVMILDEATSDLDPEGSELVFNIAKRLRLKCSGFDLDFELASALRRLGYEIAEVPISYRPRTVAEGKKIRPMDGLKAIATMLRVRFQPRKTLLREAATHETTKNGVSA